MNRVEVFQDLYKQLEDRKMKFITSLSSWYSKEDAARNIEMYDELLVYVDNAIKELKETKIN